MAIAAQCPYWRKERSESPVLNCEAGRIVFPSREARTYLVVSFCCDAENYRNCTLCRMMNVHYDANPNDAEYVRTHDNK